MIFQPLIPAWIVVLAVLAAGAALVWAYRRPGWSAGLRAAALVVVALMAANPVRVVREVETQRPVVAMVVDSSGSMATPDGDASGTPRFTVAMRAAQEAADRLAAGHRVRWYGLADRLQGAPGGDPGGDSEFSALARLAEQDPPAAIVLLSDGADWKGSDPERVLAARGIPVHAFAVGSPDPRPNLAVRLSPASPTVAPGQELALGVAVTATPGLRGRQARLVVEPVEPAGPPILDEVIDLAAWVGRTVSASAGSLAGGRLWRARIDPLPGEAGTADNEGFASVQVVEQTVRVAVLEGAPGWDASFALRAWRRDLGLEIRSRVLLGTRRLDTGGAVDLDDAGLAGTQVLVLGGGLGPVLDEAARAAITRFVDRGGHLLLFGVNAPAEPTLAQDPLVRAPGRDRLTLTSEDSLIPGLVPAGPGIPLEAGRVAGLAPHAQVLLGERERPLLVQRRIGAGWVCAVNLAGVWAWQLSSGAEPAERFWRQILRGLVRPPAGVLRIDRTQVGVAEPVSVAVDPDRGITSITIQDPAGRRSELAVDGGSARLIPDQPGLWVLTAAGARVVVVAEDRLRERTEAARDDARLARLAQATGGSVGGLADLDRLAARLQAGRQATAPRTRSEPLIASPWWLLAAAGLFAAEWWIRRRRHGVV